MLMRLIQFQRFISVLFHHVRRALGTVLPRTCLGLYRGMTIHLLQGETDECVSYRP